MGDYPTYFPRCSSVPKTPHPERRLLVSTDIEHYSRRDNRRQYDAQLIFTRVMRQATRKLGLEQVRWIRQQAGDGELAILPVDVPDAVVVGRFATTLDEMLRAHNRNLVPEARVRIRVAIDTGLVHLDGANGFPGDVTNTVCRLVDAPPLKRALAAFPDAGAALIVSDQIYREVVRNYCDGVQQARFTQVSVGMPDKDFRSTAWVYVPNEDARKLGDLDGVPPAAPEAGTAPATPAAAAPAAPTPASKFNIGSNTVNGT
jgi:hypothetical protein